MSKHQPLSNNYTSIKWISSEEKNSIRNLIVHDISNVLKGVPVGAKVNLISIFGRARQGKSFLMNCLAGEKEVFRISNEKDSCTQGNVNYS